MQRTDILKNKNKMPATPSLTSSGQNNLILHISTIISFQ